MTEKQELVKTWNDIIQKHGFLEHIQNLSDIQDDDDRGISVISRVLFLWNMAIKQERDVHLAQINKIKKLFKSGRSQSLNCARCSAIRSIINPQTESNGDVQPEEQNDVIPPSPQKSKVVLRDASNVPKKLPPKILVPETQFEESSPKPKVFPNQIPETNLCELDNEDHHSPSRFNQSISDSQENSCDSIFSSPVFGKHRGQCSMPVLSPKVKREIHFNSSPKKTFMKEKVKQTPKKKFKRNSVNSPESPNVSPSVLGCNQIYSHGVNKQVTNTESSKNLVNNAQDVNESINNTHTTIVHDKRPVTLPQSNKNCSSSDTNSSSSKSSSSKNEIVAPTNQSRLKRVKNLKSLTKNSKLNMAVEVKYSPKTDVKSYRQTTITKDGFISRKDFEPIEKTTKRPLIEEENEIEEMDDLLEPEISKETEILMKKKFKQMKKESPEKFEIIKRKTPKKSLFNSSFGSEREIGSNKNVIKDRNFAPEKSKTPQNRSLNSTKGKQLQSVWWQDSFDELPTRDKSEPGFAHQHDVVRKKDERLKLPGWVCKECKDYYEAQDLDETQLRKVVNRCSKHRSKYKPITNTPEGFWNPEIEDSDD